MAGSMAIGGYGMTGSYGMYGNAGAVGSAMQGNAQGRAQSAEKTRAGSANPDDQVKAGHKSSPSECKTCKSRKYQDGSNESDVSFKAPGHISPQASAGTVRAHEQQHVSNAYQKAAEGNGKVISATVSLRTEVCPECGTAYVAGGETRTAISYSGKKNPYQENKKALDAMNKVGSNVDYVA
ncbi:MAG: hypothetical protein ACI4EE_05770 [Lachnospiraceae bacterium]